MVLVFWQCDNDKGVTNSGETTDYSGIYCLNLQNLEMNIVQKGDSVTFTLTSELLTKGNGAISGNILQLSAITSDSAFFTAQLTFSATGLSFSGPFTVKDLAGNIGTEGILLGNKGNCPKYDITANGIPKFVKNDFTQLSKIEKISKFRSGFGHSFTDDFEECRSMKHYYNPYENYRNNNNVEIYSPVNGIVTSVLNDGHGESVGLNNKQIFIRPDDQPAFSIQLFHVDLVSANITTGKSIKIGEKLGYARLYYDDLNEYATSFDIAVWVNTPTGQRLISYFETLTDSVFNNYALRGVSSRDEFIISKETRDANLLECSGETFLNEGNLENWVILN